MLVEEVIATKRGRRKQDRQQKHLQLPSSRPFSLSSDRPCPCQWFLSDGTPPNVQHLQGDVSTSRHCLTCPPGPCCLLSPADRTRPCQWFLSDGTTPDVQDLQGDVSTCDNCHSLCAEAEHCFYSSFNGSDVARYNETNACSTGKV